MGRRAPAIPMPEALPVRALLSPGMASLLRAPGGVVQPKTPASAAPSLKVAAFSRPSRLVPVSLFLADALLAGLAAWVAVQSPGRLGWAGGALCLLALLAGAWLSCLALWLGRGAGETKPGHES